MLRFPRAVLRNVGHELDAIVLTESEMDGTVAMSVHGTQGTFPLVSPEDIDKLPQGLRPAICFQVSCPSWLVKSTRDGCLDLEGGQGLLE